MLSSSHILHVATSSALLVMVVVHGNILPVSGFAAGSSGPTATVPDFYSELVSPLAQIVAHYASAGQQEIPATLDMMEMEMELPEHEKSLLRHLLLTPPALPVVLGEEEQQQQQQQPDYLNCTTKPTPAKKTIVIPVTATFAGGCFWGIQLAYDREPGVLATCVGYTQGNSHTHPYPTYSAVSTEETGHTEACLVAYDPALVSYARLAEIMFDRIPDPTMLNRVGRDRGTQYRTGLYAHSEEQLVEAKLAFDKENRTWFGRDVVTEVKLAGTFWPAEELHHAYLAKGGRFGRPQSSQKGSTDEIRCYG